MLQSAAQGGGFVYDPDAVVIFNAIVAAGVTPTGTQKSGINTFVLSLKSASLWAKIELLYGFVGGTAATHAINWKTPGTNNITWAGTVTQDANGITPNGSTGWGDTGWATSAATIATQNSVHAYAYCRSTTPTDDGRFAAVSNTTGTSRIGLGRTSNKIEYDGAHANVSAAAAVDVSTDFRGSSCISRTGSGSSIIYARALTPFTDGTASTSTCTGTMGIGARNFQTFGPDKFSNANLACLIFGGGLSGSDYTAQDAAVVALQTTLGRNV